MKGTVIGILAFLIIGCNNEIRVHKKQIGNKLVESNFISDTIFDGPTKYYGLSGQLESLIYFSRGVKNGKGLNFYPNGKIHDSSTYFNGLKNGWYFVYDSVGQLSFKNYLFYGENIGDEIFFWNGKPFKYRFINFEKKNIFNCGYDSIGMVGFDGDILNVSSYVVSVNDYKQQGIFVYLIRPPNVNVIYSLGLLNEKTNEKNELIQLKENSFYKDTILPFPLDGLKYYVAAHYKDSINKFEKVYVRIVEN